MGLFSAAQISKINEVAAKSKEVAKPQPARSIKSINDELKRSSDMVVEYFSDSPAILITSTDQLHDYVDKCVEYGYAGIDTETTGLDRIRDHVVGASLYVPGMPECYIPMKHLVPIFDTPYKNQLSYEEVATEFNRLVSDKVKLILANADFDIAMIFKDIKVDIVPSVYYDVLLGWRCLKENERDNSLKGLYAKYPMKGQVDPKKFSDFFSPALFPYCKPEIAKLYAANDAKITFKFFEWQFPYVNKNDPKCQEHHLEKIADLIWSIEMPMIAVCAHLHRAGIYLDDSIVPALHNRYQEKLDQSRLDLARSIQSLIDEKDVASNRRRPFRTGSDFNPNSQPHVMYLLNDLLGIDAKSTGKDILNEVDHESAKLILAVRQGVKLLGTYVDKMPEVAGPDRRIHCSFKSVGAATGRMASADPNLQNIPSKLHDIRHMFRASTLQHHTLNISGNNSFVLSSISQVTIKDGDLVEASMLKQGDFICLYKDAELISAEVECIETHEGSTSVTLRGDDFEGCTLNYTSPPYVLMSSDYSQQEAKIAAFVSQDPKFIDTFMHNKDIYATLASTGLGVPYEQCLEFNPVTGENQPEGKKRRNIGKVLLLGINYGMSVHSIADMLFSDRDDLTDEQKLKEGEKIQQLLTRGFPQLQKCIADTQNRARQLGYTETILGRRRHHPDMQLPRFEFRPMKGYVNPDVDPLDPSTLQNKDQIPQRIINALTKEFSGYKYYGQIVKRTKQLAEEKIKVINNSTKISSAERECFNATIQGSAADLTKMAMLRLENDPEWKAIGGRLLIPVHDELIAEVPFAYRKKGAELLAKNMESAGSFFPFPLTCDVETTFRWYGLAVEDILSFDKPNTLNKDELTESNIKWIQCMICENEYPLPKFNEADGRKPQGIAAEGVNGIWTEELESAIADYRKRYTLHTDAQFIEHIETKVISGQILFFKEE